MSSVLVSARFLLSASSTGSLETDGLSDLNVLSAVMSIPIVGSQHFPSYQVTPPLPL